jgi:plasmid stability protein
LNKVDIIAIFASNDIRSMRMAALTIRNIDEVLKQRLRQRAATNNRSMEEEVRTILRTAVGKLDGGEPRGLATEIRKQVERLGGGIDWELPDRGPARPVPSAFDE